MKKITFLIPFFALLLIAGFSMAQTKSCCSTASTTQFAMLANDASFNTAHLSPEPFHFVAEKGTDITFPVTGDKEGKAFFVKANGNSDKFLLVFHEWWGLNDYIRKEAERFAADFPDVNILAIDLYDGQLATNADDAGKIMQSVKTERAEALIKGALNYIGPTAKIQTTGWCFGGGWALQAAILAGKQAVGCVMYYGMPEKDPAKLRTLNAPVLGIFALKDDWITKPIVEEFQKQMKELNKPVTVSWFDAVHAFANPSNPKYDEAAASKARVMAVGFMRGKFSK